MSVPSVSQVRLIPELDLCQVEGDEGELTTFRGGDNVFLAHEGMDLSDRPVDGDLYWKGKIVSVHMKAPEKDDSDDSDEEDDPEPCYLIVRWYYSVEDMNKVKITDSSKSSLRAFGRNELALSTHEDVVDLSCLESECFIHQYDDRDGFHQPIHKTWWVVRTALRIQSKKYSITGMNVHCVCNNPYEPDRDRQRFCQKCKVWFDEGCLGIPSTNSISSDISDVQRVAQMPILRGSYEGMDEWSLTGSGYAVRQAYIWLEEMDSELPEDWEATLGKELVEFARSQETWQRFKCPKCKARII
ncbi:hypothetical protein BDZ97DRAFT_1923397 [Flammula alnicola]|nr:hypothetical protein BDZ97DRAFT_1923397 [Flammula alnicola]